MRLIYNDALNKRIAPYLERLTKKRTSLDKETMTLLDVFMQYFNMDTRYGAYSDKLEPCIIYIIQEVCSFQLWLLPIAPFEDPDGVILKQCALPVLQNCCRLSVQVCRIVAQNPAVCR